MKNTISITTNKGNQNVTQLSPDQISQADKLQIIKDKIILKYNIHYSLKHSVYFYFINEQWIQKSDLELRKNHTELSRDTFPKFQELLKSMGRWKDDVVSTFNPVGSNVLNLMSDTFLTPDYSERHHPLFDLLIQSLGNDKPENMEHLEKIVVAKYRHPHQYMLPAIVFSDPSGRSGKDIWVRQVLGKIVGEQQTAVLDIKDCLGQFNSGLANKAVVMINESTAGQSELNGLKQLIGNPYFTINAKFEKPYKVDNCALYVLASNSRYGTIHLERNNTTERYSFITPSTKMLAGWVGEWLNAQGINTDPLAWLQTQGRAIFADENEVAKYLGYLLTKYANENLGSLAPLHGDDFKATKSTQHAHSFEEATDNLCETIFTSGTFRCIEQTVLFQLYEIKCRNEGVGIPKARSFQMGVAEWVKANAPLIDYSRVSIKGAQKWMWINSGVTAYDTSSQYVSTTDLGKIVSNITI